MSSLAVFFCVIQRVSEPTEREMKEFARLRLPLEAPARPAKVDVRAIDPASFERKLLSRDGLNVPFLELNYGSYRIWGATAGMLWNLSQKLVAHGGAGGKEEA